MKGLPSSIAGGLTAYGIFLPFISRGSSVVFVTFVSLGFVVQNEHLIVSPVGPTDIIIKAIRVGSGYAVGQGPTR